MPINSDKDRLTHFGDLITQFANAKDSDDAYKEFFGKLAIAFEFSKEFSEKYIDQLPSMEMLKPSVTKDEMALLDIIKTENDYKWLIKEGFESINMNFEDYNWEKEQ